MNRREAIAALVSLPGVTRIASAHISPTDVIVVECEGSVSQELREHIQQQMESVWPGRKVVVCEGGLRIKVVSQ